jgi:hypothetical protein
MPEDFESIVITIACERTAVGGHGAPYPSKLSGQWLGPHRYRHEPMWFWWLRQHSFRWAVWAHHLGQRKCLGTFQTKAEAESRASEIRTALNRPDAVNYCARYRIPAHYFDGFRGE